MVKFCSSVSSCSLISHSTYQFCLISGVRKANDEVFNLYRIKFTLSTRMWLVPFIDLIKFKKLKATYQILI